MVYYNLLFMFLSLQSIWTVFRNILSVDEISSLSWLFYELNLTWTVLQLMMLNKAKYKPFMNITVFKSTLGIWSPRIFFPAQPKVRGSACLTHASRLQSLHLYVKRWAKVRNSGSLKESISGYPHLWRMWCIIPIRGDKECLEHILGYPSF